jgi:catechol 2,3-dioxygenase-like lactoylglutathione lyase family enzyme
MLGHLGINVPDLRAAKRYYDSIMPLLEFEVFLHADDEFAYRPVGGKPGTYLFYPSAEKSRTRGIRRVCSTWHSCCAPERR